MESIETPCASFVGRSGYSQRQGHVMKAESLLSQCTIDELDIGPRRYSLSNVP